MNCWFDYSYLYFEYVKFEASDKLIINERIYLILLLIKLKNGFYSIESASVDRMLERILDSPQFFPELLDWKRWIWKNLS